MFQKLPLGILCLLVQTSILSAAEVTVIPPIKQPPSVTENDTNILPKSATEVKLSMPPAIPVDIPRIYTDAERQGHEALRHQESLSIQSTMKWIAILMAIIAFVQTCIIGLGTVLLRRTLKETSKATEAAKLAAHSADKTIEVTREIGSLQLRPYLVISQISNINAGPLTRLSQSESREGLQLSATINNAGLTPAYKIRVALKIVSDKGLIWETALIYGAIIKEIPYTFDKVFEGEVFPHFHKYPDVKGSLWVVIEYEDATSQEFTQRYNYDVHLPAPKATWLKVELSLKPSMEEILSTTI